MFLEIGALKGDKLHPRLNIRGTPLAKKYREGKMKRTLEKELKEPEISVGEPVKWMRLLRAV